MDTSEQTKAPTSDHPKSVHSYVKLLCGKQSVSSRGAHVLNAVLEGNQLILIEGHTVLWNGGR